MSRFWCAVTLIVAGCMSSTDTGPEAPSRIIALTRAGDVVVVNRVSRTQEAVLTSFRWRKDAETGLIYGRAEDLTALPDGRVLVSTCCEPAGGNVFIVQPNGERAQALHGWDPQVDPAGERIAIAGIPWITIHNSSALAGPPIDTLDVDPDLLDNVPADPAWSLDGRRLAFTVGGRIGVVSAAAASLADAALIDPPNGAWWSSPVFTNQGVVAVESRNVSGSHEPVGPSTLMSVDLATGETTELASSSTPIVDVAVVPSGHYLVWTGKDGLRWRIDGVTSTLAGDFVAAAWDFSGD